jgi:hypothetical protein
MNFRSSHGRKKLEISPTSSGRALKTEIKKVMDLDQDFIVRRDNRGRPGMFKSSTFKLGSSLRDSIAIPVLGDITQILSTNLEPNQFSTHATDVKLHKLWNLYQSSPMSWFKCTSYESNIENLLTSIDFTAKNWQFQAYIWSWSWSIWEKDFILSVTNVKTS